MLLQPQTKQHLSRYGLAKDRIPKLNCVDTCLSNFTSLDEQHRYIAKNDVLKSLATNYVSDGNGPLVQQTMFKWLICVFFFNFCFLFPLLSCEFSTFSFRLVRFQSILLIFGLFTHLMLLCNDFCVVSAHFCRVFSHFSHFVWLTQPMIFLSFFSFCSVTQRLFTHFVLLPNEFLLNFIHFYRFFLSSFHFFFGHSAILPFALFLCTIYLFGSYSSIYKFVHVCRVSFPHYFPHLFRYLLIPFVCILYSLDTCPIMAFFLQFFFWFALS